MNPNQPPYLGAFNHYISSNSTPDEVLNPRRSRNWEGGRFISTQPRAEQTPAAMEGASDPRHPGPCGGGEYSFAAGQAGPGVQGALGGARAALKGDPRGAAAPRRGRESGVGSNLRAGVGRGLRGGRGSPGALPRVERRSGPQRGGEHPPALSPRRGSAAQPGPVSSEDLAARLGAADGGCRRPKVVLAAGPCSPHAP